MLLSIADYNVYSKGLFDKGEKQGIYRPKQEDSGIYGDGDTQYEQLKKTDKFRPDKDFQGVDRSKEARRDGPVQFEKEEDPFGIDQFLTEAKRGKNALDSIGSKGSMAASAGSNKREHYEGGSHRR